MNSPTCAYCGLPWVVETEEGLKWNTPCRDCPARYAPASELPDEASVDEVATDGDAQ